MEIEASLAEVWDAYFDRPGWRSWVDGFGSVESDSGYPETGGTLVWRSRPDGRGTVTERVLEHEPRRRHRVAYEDDHASGELLTTFAIEGSKVVVSQEHTYRLRESGAFGPLTDFLFVRGQMQRSLARSLGRLRYEVAGRSPEPPGPEGEGEAEAEG